MNHEALIEAEFSRLDSIIHLNHAGVAPWPERTAEAVRRFADENVRQGSLNYEAWLKTEVLLRKQAQQLLNAPSHNDIALLKNTSEGLSMVAYGLDWQRGDNIVISDAEFPSNRIVWESLQSQGVEVRQAPLAAAQTPEDALFQQVDEHTRLISISSVQFASGLRMDLERIGDFCHRHHLLFCVDAIQSLGALPCDVQAIQADFL
ncbi:MAG: aminotransferase class V-fold PLP-dependent enzyme, partial [Gammaproteobacteria bacterium]